MDAFDADVRTAIEEGVADARQAIHDEEPKLGEHVNGWHLSRDLGRYGTNTPTGRPGPSSASAAT